VSLLLHKGEIARAVLGELSPPDEERLRVHLRACAACRGHYDALAGAKQAVGGGAGEAARERARLFAALEGRAPAPARRSRAWLGAGLVLAPAAAIVLWLARPAPDTGVTMRGGAETSAPRPAATVVLYASRKTGPATRGPLRLVGELPGSGEARVSLDDYLQLAVRGLRAPAHVRVAIVDAAGAARTLVGDTLVTPKSGGVPVTLGGSVDVARALAAGSARIVALFSDAPLDEAAVRDAVARLDPARVERGAGPRASVVSGSLVIE
jgi:hypothetical protein